MTSSFIVVIKVFKVSKFLKKTYLILGEDRTRANDILSICSLVKVRDT